MAGDWIKMRSDLQTHPKVVRISSALKADKLRVIGGLHAVWSLFDAHSSDGTLEGYTSDALDHYVGWLGFCAELMRVGWLQGSGESLTTPRFDEHNGQSAKRRAQETQRKRVSRATGEMSADDADKKRSREEKRREDISVSKDTGGKPPSDPVKQEIWDAGRSILQAARMPAKQVGTFLGKLVQDHGSALVLDAVRAAVKEQPADPAEYLKACCQHAAGQRKHAEPEWRAEQRERTQLAAPGVAAGQAAADFFIDVEARNVTPNALA